MIWVPFWAAGVINGLSHWWGYRNTATPDTSRNLIPWAVWIGGEELHNNHHSDGANPKFKQRWWEFDIGWAYIQILQMLGLATLRSKS
jgi:stearoyl-CoA desaturase (delta-9 desaturase)